MPRLVNEVHLELKVLDATPAEFNGRLKPQARAVYGYTPPDRQAEDERVGVLHVLIALHAVIFPIGST